MVGIFYNRNNAAASRGSESDLPSEYKEFKSLAHFVSWMVDEYIFWIDAFDDDEVEDASDVGYLQSLIDSGDIDMECIIDALDSADITGGFPIVFSVEVDGTTYKTDWDPEDWEDLYDDDDDDY